MSKGALSQPKSNPNNEFDYFLKLLGEYFRVQRELGGFKNANTFANLIDIAETQYRQYERGEIDMQLSTFLKIMKGLDKSVENIFMSTVFQVLSDTHDVNSFPSSLGSQVRHQVTLLNGEVTQQSLVEKDIERIVRILRLCLRPTNKGDLLKNVGLSSKTKNFNKIFNLLLTNNWIAMRFPETPNRPNQKYETTSAGKAVIVVT